MPPDPGNNVVNHDDSNTYNDYENDNIGGKSYDENYDSESETNAPTIIIIIIIVIGTCHNKGDSSW